MQANVPRHSGLEIIRLSFLHPCRNGLGWTIVSNIFELAIWTVLVATVLASAQDIIFDHP
jgi:hypothetical protein